MLTEVTCLFSRTHIELLTVLEKNANTLKDRSALGKRDKMKLAQVVTSILFRIKPGSHVRCRMEYHRIR